MKIEQISREYLNNGYVILPNFYNDERVKSIRDEVPKCIDTNDEIKIIYEEDGTTIRSVMSYHDKNVLLSQFTRDQRILYIVESIIGSQVYVSQSKINLKRGILGKKWDFHRGFTFWNTLDGIPETDMVSVFVNLTKQTSENGAVYILENSHKGISLDNITKESIITSNDRKKDTDTNLSIQIKPDYLERYKRKFKTTHLIAEPGDVILMHPNLLHASNDNNTNESRDLMITVYNSVNNLPTKFDRPTYLSERFKGEIKPHHFS